MPLNASIGLTNLSIHQSSYRETFTERALRVVRPQVNESMLDPEVYLQQASYADATLVDNTLLLNAWTGLAFDAEQKSSGSGALANQWTLKVSQINE